MQLPVQPMVPICWPRCTDAAADHDRGLVGVEGDHAVAVVDEHAVAVAAAAAADDRARVGGVDRLTTRRADVDAGVQATPALAVGRGDRARRRPDQAPATGRCVDAATGADRGLGRPGEGGADGRLLLGEGVDLGLHVGDAIGQGGLEAPLLLLGGPVVGQPGLDLGPLGLDLRGRVTGPFLGGRGGRPAGPGGGRGRHRAGWRWSTAAPRGAWSW